MSDQENETRRGLMRHFGLVGIIFGILLCITPFVLGAYGLVVIADVRGSFELIAIPLMLGAVALWYVGSRKARK